KLDLKEQKTRVKEAAKKGAKTALPFVTGIFPYLTAIFVMTELFEISGLSDLLTRFLQPFFSLFGIPAELDELVLLKPFSGSGSLALLNEIFNKYGVDSYLARAASAVYGSSETVFYVAAVYFATAKTKNLIKPIIISLIASFFSCVVACLICRFI
ncbi:MAG: spore maturation protein, partial [Clostridia bacterium]|nr:spore maturation protein [Clostridia bacterium]